MKLEEDLKKRSHVLSVFRSASTNNTRGSTFSQPLVRTTPVCSVRVPATRTRVDKRGAYLEAIRSIIITHAPLELKTRLLYLSEGKNTRWPMCKDCHKQRGENWVFCTIISTFCARVQLCGKQEVIKQLRAAFLPILSFRTLRGLELSVRRSEVIFYKSADV